MLIFSGNSNKPLAEKIVGNLGFKLGNLEITTFPDNENRVRVIDNVLGQDCVVIQSTGISPNLYYIELFFILDSLKRSGAKSITLVIPYLGYQRQDHIFREGEAVSLEVIIKILENLGVSKVISLDLHSVKIPELFHVPITHLSALSLFAEEIKKMNQKELILVSPDMGGIARIEKLSKLCGDLPFVSIVKDRDLDSGNIRSTKINGKLRRIALIIDDVISTGETLIAAANLLQEEGAKEVYAFSTHGIFADSASENLQNSVIKKVIVSDTIEFPKNKKFDKLEIISVSNLISGIL